jgi:phosphatidylglycerophosphate synthase
MIYVFALMMRIMFFAFAALIVSSFVLLWICWQGLCILAVIVSDGMDGYTARKERRRLEGKRAPQARFSDRR